MKNKNGIMWSNTASLILILIAVILLLLFIYLLRDRLKDYIDVLLDFLRL